MSSSNKNFLQRDFAAGVYLSDFVGSESGQIPNVKLLQNMVSNRTQHPHTLPATHCPCILFFDTGKGVGGRVEPERRLEGAAVHKARSKIPT
jgi:hypothetical protein